jgi:hypothetical protein
VNSAFSFSSDLVKAEKQSRFNPLKSLTADRLSAYLDEFRSGYLRNLSQVMDAIEERDDTLASVVPKAKAAVARHGWEILTVDTQDEATAAEAQRQKEVLEAFYNNLTATSAVDQDERGGMALLLRQMMDAKGKRYAVHNLVWSHAQDGYTAQFIQCPLWFFENTEGRMRFIATPYGLNGVDMDPGAWMVTKGRGVMIACAVAWMYKHIPLRDWLVYCSRHGMPGIEGVTDAAVGTEEWNNLVTAVEKAASEFAWVRNRSSEIKAIEFSATGELPYPALVERMDRAMAALWRGADLSTISAGQGQGQGASLQGEESDIIEDDDIGWLSETLNYKIDPLVLEYTFGKGTRALAYVKVSGAQKTQTDLDLRIDEFLAKHKFPISVKATSERYNRPLPAPDDDLLEAPAAPSFGPMGQDRGLKTEDRGLRTEDGGLKAEDGRQKTEDGDQRAEGSAEVQAEATDETALNEAAPASALRRALAADLQPFRARLAAILDISDPALQRAKLVTLLEDYETLKKDLMADPDSARVLESELASGMAAGIAQANRDRTLPERP